MKTFLEFLNESNNKLTSNPSKKFIDMMPTIIDSIFDSWFKANGVNILSSKVVNGNRAYFGSKGDKYYKFSFYLGRSFSTVKFSMLSEDNIKILTKRPDTDPAEIMDVSQFKFIDDILTL
jgi:hypothetical protein